MDDLIFLNLYISSVFFFFSDFLLRNNCIQLEEVPRQYFTRAWRTIGFIICPHSIVPTPPALPQLSLISFTLPIQDEETYRSLTHLTTFDSALGYPFLHAAMDNRIQWFASVRVKELLRHTLAVRGSVGLLGITKIIARPDGSAVIAPLAFGIEKFAFVLAWVSGRSHSVLCTMSHGFQAVVEMRDIGGEYDLSHELLDPARLDYVASCSTELMDYFTSVLSMSNKAIASVDAVAARSGLMRWFDLSLC